MKLLPLAAAAAALAITVGAAAPAHAALPASHWSAAALPSGLFPVSGPVSCAPGTHSCLAVVLDNSNPEAPVPVVVATSDSGQAWTRYASLPATLGQVLALSCPTATVCWAAGLRAGTQSSPDVAQTTDAGRTWTDKTPAAWAGDFWWPMSVDCLSARTCWFAGTRFLPGNVDQPRVVATTSAGAQWTTFGNLPDLGSGGPYQLTGISCVAVASCVAVGGLNVQNGFGTPTGPAVTLTTLNGGASWRLAQPSGIETLYSVSCVRSTLTCFASGGTSSALSPSSDSAMIAVSHDDGLTWQSQVSDPHAGWNLDSISCSGAGHCWAAANGFTTEAVMGTADGGRSWSSVTQDGPNGNYGAAVSCLSTRVCVATTDARLWVTSDDGGLG